VEMLINARAAQICVLRSDIDIACD